MNGGETWVGKDFGEGYFTELIHLDNLTYALKKSEDNTHVFVYSFSVNENAWRKEDNFPDKIYDLVSSGNSLLAISSDSLRSRSKINISYNKGGSWGDLNFIRYQVYGNVIAHDGKILYLSSNINGGEKANLVIEYDLHDSSCNVIQLPNKFDCYLLTNHQDKIRLTGVEEGHITVYSLHKDKYLKLEYFYEGSDKYFPKGYFNTESSEWVIVGDRNGSDVSNLILQTDNNGRSWKTISFPMKKHIRPFTFNYKNNKVKGWFYAGEGLFQVLE
jgi:hypothetical protein